jgi:hypothetical protein
MAIKVETRMALFKTTGLKRLNDKNSYYLLNIAQETGS